MWGDVTTYSVSHITFGIRNKAADENLLWTRYNPSDTRTRSSLIINRFMEKRENIVCFSYQSPQNFTPLPPHQRLRVIPLAFGPAITEVTGHECRSSGNNYRVGLIGLKGGMSRNHRCPDGVSLGVSISWRKMGALFSCSWSPRRVALLSDPMPFFRPTFPPSSLTRSFHPSTIYPLLCLTLFPAQYSFFPLGFLPALHLKIISY